jgi:hypothetical protein
VTGRISGRRGQTRIRWSDVARYGTNCLAAASVEGGDNCLLPGHPWLVQGRTDLERLKVPRPAMDKLIQELVAKCLVSFWDLYRTRQAALRV